MQTSDLNQLNDKQSHESLKHGNDQSVANNIATALTGLIFSVVTVFIYFQRGALAALLANQRSDLLIGFFLLVWTLSAFLIWYSWHRSRKPSRELTHHLNVEENLMNEQRFLAALMNNVPDFIFFKDKESRYLRINKATSNQLGLAEPSLAIGKQDCDFYSADFANLEYANDQLILRTGRPIIGNLVEQVWPNGHRTWVSTTKTAIRDDAGNIVGLVGISRDMTERKKEEDSIKERAEHCILAAQGASDGLWDWNLRDHTMYFSASWQSIVGHRAEPIDNPPFEWLSRIHPSDLERVISDLRVHLAGFTSQFENEHRLLHQDGTYRWVRSRGRAVRDLSNVAYRIAGSQTDITKHKEIEEQLLHDASHDDLTGLANRAHFTKCLQQVIDHTKESSDNVSVLMFLDVDRFKTINDSLGHALGDDLLSQLKTPQN